MFASKRSSLARSPKGSLGRAAIYKSDLTLEKVLSQHSNTISVGLLYCAIGQISFKSPICNSRLITLIDTNIWRLLACFYKPFLVASERII